jgi:hypothetical protein
MSTVAVTRQGPRPEIRLRPAPRHEPPFDDERDPRTWPTPHQLALDWSRPLAPAPPRSLPPSRPPVRRTVVTGASADARRAVRRFVSTCVEVLNGYRPAAHLRRLSQPREAATVVAQGVVGARRVSEARQATVVGRNPRGVVGARRVSEARQATVTGRNPRPRRPAPAAVVRLQLCEPREGAVEAAAVLVIGEKTHAMALRLELHDKTWLATALRLI